MAEDERQAVGPRADGPVYEPIGPGWNSGTQDTEDDDGWAPPHPGPVRVALVMAVSDCLRTVRTFRFWLVSAAVPLVTSLVAWILVAVAPIDDLEQPAALHWAYLLAAALMPAVSSLLALQWAIAGFRRFSRHPDPLARVPGLLAAFFAVALRGLVVAAMALLLLLVVGGPAGAPGTIAATSAGVIVLESGVFGAIGAGVCGMFRRRWWATVAGWTVAGFLVLGNVLAVSALLPAVRADEPVAVAMNVDWGPGGTREAYDCAPELRGTAEVFHTERIVWMVAANPTVIFVMLAGRAGTDEEEFGWISTSLQEAADGTQVPCVNAEPRVRNAPGMPLELIGLATQAVLAATFLAGGHVAARRRSGSGG